MNRAAGLFARLEKGDSDRCLSHLDETTAREIRDLMQYPSDTAGRLMDPGVLAFNPSTAIDVAMRHLRKRPKRRVQDIYLTNPDGLLVGSVRVEDLILSPRKKPLEAFARGMPPSVQATAPLHEVVEILESQRVRSVPVVDFEGRLLGVMRQEELLSATEQSASADMVTMVGASKEERALSSPLFSVRKRLPWLEINLLTAFLAASVVGLFEGTIARFTALAVLLPVVAGQSGNTGAQALAVTMRGLALREVRVRNWLQIAGKEITAGAINGVAIAATTSVGVLIWSQSIGLALVIGVSMVLSMTIAGLAGAVIPMALTKLGQDPAQSSSIVLTTVTDIVGFFSFLGIATLMASMLSG
jgi:magnesium transporter